MSSWPTTLPPPSAYGYALNPVDQTVRTEMEGGAARARRRTTARNDRLNVAFELTDAQLAIFRAWFEDAATGAAGGAGWFSTTLALGTGGKVATTARFIGAYKVAYVPVMNWTVTAELEIR